jgi:isocitrate dehydrogenase
MTDMVNMVRTLDGQRVPLGETISFWKDGKPVTPTRPIIPFIAGDGIGPEIWAQVRKIVDAAVKMAYNGNREIAWLELFAGETAMKLFGNPLPEDTLAGLKEFGVGIKGPLGTPTGGGMRSLNVALRKHRDMYQCVRPVRFFTGVPSPIVRPQDVDVVIFRENTEDLYAGIEFTHDSPEAKQLRDLLKTMGYDVSEDSGLGIKPISRTASRRIVRRAMEYAIKNNRKTVTLVGKGNIQKFTEGAFVAWGFEIAKELYGDIVITEEDLWSKYNGAIPDGKILVNYRITDAMFADIVARPNKYSVICTTNLNGDYLSDLVAALVGGLGIAPGGNIGDLAALFEATHGTAPDIAGKNLANPTSMLLSAVMMLEYIGWQEAADLIVTALKNAFIDKKVTGDMARFIKGAKALSTSEFGDVIVSELGNPLRTPRLTVRQRFAGMLRRLATSIDD